MAANRRSERRTDSDFPRMRSVFQVAEEPINSLIYRSNSLVHVRVKRVGRGESVIDCLDNFKRFPFEIFRENMFSVSAMKDILISASGITKALELGRTQQRAADRESCNEADMEEREPKVLVLQMSELDRWRKERELEPVIQLAECDYITGHGRKLLFGQKVAPIRDKSSQIIKEGFNGHVVSSFVSRGILFRQKLDRREKTLHRPKEGGAPCRLLAHFWTWESSTNE